jgi:formylglycine-generating enzyme required for sulfatase activity
MTYYSMRIAFLCACSARGLILLGIVATPTAAVTISTVPVGNAGNGGEVQSQGTFGAVAYDYRIGSYEVTNDQYAEFLNVKAASDPLGLYNTDMGSDVRGGIIRNGSDGSYAYATKANMGNKPVNFVSWYDAVRFANWLHNGQGAGDTENGAYTLESATQIPSNGLSVVRNPGAVWFLTSENEWYKAAYYDPTLAGGGGDYWNYPTRSNSAPAGATANSNGDISNPGANVANYNLQADWNGLNGNVTTVGSAGPLSESFYGTSDQGGNVGEWTESLFKDSSRVIRGGWWNFSPFDLESTHHNWDAPAEENRIVGFRVATVPEPGTAVLGMIGFALTLRWRRRE